MKTTILAVIIALAVLLPSTAQASCSGFIDCLFGMTERTEVRAERDIEKARIEAAAQAEVTRVQGGADTRIRLYGPVRACVRAVEPRFEPA